MALDLIESPGLTEGETAFRLDDGTLVAVAVHSEWLPNGEGMVGVVRSRWIDAEGGTQTCAHDQPVTRETRHTFSSSYVERHGAELLTKQLVLLALGEEPDAIEITNPDKTTILVPVVDLGEEGRAQASVKSAVKLAKAATRKGDAAKLLKLKAPAPKKPATAGR